jgi:predicted Zn-dependent protease
MMNRQLILGLLFTLIFVACSKVPITNRKQLNLLPESQMMSMSYAQYDQFLKENSVISSANSQAQDIKRIGNKMAAAVNEFLKKEGNLKRVKGYQWDFNLVQDDQINAWCMPGGKVVFYTGILPICKDEDGIAVVMSHEIAHAIARHGNERMSQQLAIQLGGMSLATATQEKPEALQAIFNQAYGIGSTLGALAFSRNQESEADKMGLVFMAMAGYDPEKAIEFWERMSSLGGQKPPELMSTHPSDERRIADIKAYLPEAKKYYKN